MRINLIGRFDANSGLTQDAMILRGLLTVVYGENVQIRRVHYVMPQCGEAELNIFLEVTNTSLLSYAAKNIWIPNPEWTYRAWIPYISMFDEIWVKTREASGLFQAYSPNVHYIGWTSIDKVYTTPKNYSKAVVLVGKNIHRNPKPVLQAYLQIKQSNELMYSKLPTLYIPYNPEHVRFFKPDLGEKVVYLEKTLTESEYDALLHECGLAICLSVAEGFGHAVNEAMSAGCNLILSSIAPFFELTDMNGLFCKERDTLEHPSCLGVLIDTSVDSFMQEIVRYAESGFKAKQTMSETLRGVYETRHATFIGTMRQRLESTQTDAVYELHKTFPAESDLPDVSIITLTHNRRIFMPLAQYCYMIQSYPEHKLEWVIVDDGDDCIEDTLFGIPNVKYVRLDKKTSIGQKRNIGVEAAMYDTLVMMDDDDVYPNNSVLHRVAMMGSKQCVFTTTIPCYDIQKHISFMNVPPYMLPMSERVSEATLAFTRAFWEAGKFLDIQIAEGNTFIRGRESMCREVSPQEVIVSLVHSKNSSSRKVPVGEPNGCHYGFNDQLFAVVSEIGINQKETDGGATDGATCGAGDLPLQEERNP